MEATAAATSKPSLLSPVPLWRRVCASLALGAVAGLWAKEVGFRSTAALWLFVPLGVAFVAMHIDRVLPQVFFRAVAWMQLGLGTLAAVFAGQWSPVAIAGGGAAALLFLGGAPFATEGVRREFAPIGYRRMFLFACVTLLGASYILALAGWDWMFSLFHHRRAGLASFVEGALLFASVIGVLRMRGWGVLTALVAGVAGGAAVLVAAIPDARGLLGVATYDHLAVRWVFGIAGASALLMVAPIVVSWVFPARPSAADDPPRAPWLHAALVMATVAVAVAGVAHGGILRFD